MARLYVISTVLPLGKFAAGLPSGSPSRPDEAAQKLAAWMDDSSVPFQVRAKIAQDLLDRAGLGAAQVHKIMPITEDPIEALFKSILDDPNGLMAPVEPLALATSPDDDLIGVVAEHDETAPLAPEHHAAGPKVAQAGEPLPKKNPTIPPKHIREGLALLL